MPLWTEASNHKLTLIFTSTDELKEFKIQLDNAFSYLDTKYSDKPKDPIVVVLDLDKLDLDSSSDPSNN